MRARLLCDAGRIEDGAAVEILTRAEAPPPSEPASVRDPEYTVRDEAGHEEAVSTRDFQLLR
jgi:hypothetical protein